VNLAPAQFQPHWASIPASHDGGLGSRTHGVAVLQDGRIAVLAQAKPAVHIFSADGRLVDYWGDGLGGAHGLTSVLQDGEESLWITDQESGAVGRYDLGGKLLQTIAPPPQSDGPYAPTQVGVAPHSGDIFVADGYGSNIVRRYTSSGRLLSALTGEGSSQRFARPHGLAFDEQGFLYVADRRNRRVVVYNEQGNFHFETHEGLHSPCGITFGRDCVIVPELFGGIKVFDRAFRLLGTYGTNVVQRPVEGWEGQEGWGWPVLPNWPDDLGKDLLSQIETWIAPHACAMASDGTIHVVEWVRGGRITKIVPDVSHRTA